jgi:hypothetical protein
MVPARAIAVVRIASSVFEGGTEMLRPLLVNVQRQRVRKKFFKQGEVFLGRC